MAQSEGSTSLGAVLPENRELASEMLCFFKKQTMDKSQKRRLCQLTWIMLCSLCWISSLLKMGEIGHPKKSVRNYHATL